MWRTTKLKKRPVLFVVYIFLRSLFLSGPISIFEFSNANPLLVIMLGAVWVVHWDWKLLVVVPFTISANFLMGALVGDYTHTLQVLRQVEDFHKKHGHRKFVPLTTGDYLEALYQSSPNHKDKKDDEFAESMLSRTEYYLADYLRFVVIEKEKDSGVGVLTTFTIRDRAWIFLDTPPQRMKASKHFTVLHEVGHTELIGLLSYGMRLSSKVLIFSLPLIVLISKWETSTVVILLILFGIYIWTRASTVEFQLKHMRFYDELNADIFAFTRSPKHWFEQYSAQDIEDVATALCKNSPLSEGQSASRMELDAQLTDEQVEWRRRTFSHNIKRLLNDQRPVTDDTVPLAPAKSYHRKRLIQLVLSTLLLIALGLQHTQLTTGRFVGIVVAMSLTIFLGIFVSQYATALADHWDNQFGFKKELSWGRRSNLKGYLQFRTFLKQSKALREGRIDSEQFKASLEDRDIQEDFYPPGITGTLFLPDELDIFVDKVKGEACIFHGKIIDYDISYLEYYSENYSIVVVMKNETRLDLGVTLPWLVRPHFLKAKKIKIARTENRKIKDEIIVSLRKAERRSDYRGR